MIGDVTLGSNNLSKGALFYDALAAEMGTQRIAGSEDAGFIAWGPPDGTGGISIIKPYNGHAATVGNGVMVALLAKSRDEVDRLHQKALSIHRPICFPNSIKRGRHFNRFRAGGNYGAECHHL